MRTPPFAGAEGEPAIVADPLFAPVLESIRTGVGELGVHLSSSKTDSAITVMLGSPPFRVPIMCEGLEYW